MVWPKPALTQGKVSQIEGFADKGVYYGSIKLGEIRHNRYHYEGFDDESNKT